MHAVVVRNTFHDFEQAMKVLREEGVPRLLQVPGFVAGQWVRLDEKTGTSMLTFESEEAAQAVANMLRTNPPGGAAITHDSVELGEVLERA